MVSAHTPTSREGKTSESFLSSASTPGRPMLELAELPSAPVSTPPVITVTCPLVSPHHQGVHLFNSLMHQPAHSLQSDGAPKRENYFSKGENLSGRMTAKKNFHLLPALSRDPLVTVHQHRRVTAASPPPTHLCPLALVLATLHGRASPQRQGLPSCLCSFRKGTASEKLEA